MWFERTHTVRKGLGKHSNGAIGEVHGRAAEPSLPVQSAGRLNIVRYIGDVHFEVPAAVGAMFDEDGVVEIARGLSIDGDDRQVAEIFAARTLSFTHGLRAMLRFIQNFAGEYMREMMLADDDFGVDPEIAGTPENFDDPSGRRCASLRITQQLHVYHGSVQFIQPRYASQSEAGFIRAAEAQLLPQPRRQFAAARNHHLVLDPNIVRQHHILLRAIAKQTHHRRMCPAKDSNDAAFRTLCAGDAAQTLNLCQYVVAVHGVLDPVARDEYIAVELRHR